MEMLINTHHAAAVCYSFGKSIDFHLKSLAFLYDLAKIGSFKFMWQDEWNVSQEEKRRVLQV